MNYLKQINGFWNWRKLNTVSHTQADLYFTILDCANSAGWRQDFSAPNSTLMRLCQISKTQLSVCRNQLAQLGLIEYKPGKRSNSGTYRIIPLYESENEVKSGTNPGSNHGTHSGTNSGNIYKEKEKGNLNKTFMKKKYQKNVSLSDEEYETLVERYGMENVGAMIERLDGYKEESGKQYKSDFAAINRWVASAVLADSRYTLDCDLYHDNYDHEKLMKLSRNRNMEGDFKRTS